MSRAYFGQLPDAAWNVGLGRDRGHQQLDLALALAARLVQQSDVIVRGEVWAEQFDRSQVQRTLCEPLQDEGELPTESRGVNAQIRLGLGHVKLLDAIGEHRRVRVLSIQRSRIHLAEMHEEPSVEPMIGADQALQASDELSIGDVADFVQCNVLLCHDYPP